MDARHPPVLLAESLAWLEKPEKKDFKDYKGVWVFAEQRKGKVQSVAYELIGKARELADKVNTYVGAVLIGNNLEIEAQSLICSGADTVYLVESPQVANFLDEPYANVLIKLIQKYKPEVVLSGATFMGRSLVSRVAVKVDCGLTADCTGLDIEAERKILLQTRPAFGGNIMATIISPNYRPQMATVRHNTIMKRDVRARRNARRLGKFDHGREF